MLGIAIASFLGTTLLGTGSWLLILGLLIALQYFRVIEGMDLLIIAVLSLLLLMGFRPFAYWVTPTNALLIIVTAGLLAVVFLLLFQILFRLLRTLL